MSKKRLLNFEDKTEMDIIFQFLLKRVYLDICVLMVDMSLSHCPNGAWMNNLFMLGVSKNTTSVSCTMSAFSTPS